MRDHELHNESRPPEYLNNTRIYGIIPAVCHCLHLVIVVVRRSLAHKGKTKKGTSPRNLDTPENDA